MHVQKVPVKVRPENLLHSNNIGVKAQASSNIADHDCNVVNRRPKACDTSVISGNIGDICENNISIGNFELVSIVWSYGEPSIFFIDIFLLHKL